MFNLAIGLEDAAKRLADKDALVSGSLRITFKELNEMANEVANGLIALGLQPNDKVGLSSPNIHLFPIIYYGILKAGGTVVPLSILLKKDEIAYHLADADIKYYFCFEGTDILPMGKEGVEGYKQVSTCEKLILMPADSKGGNPFDSGISFNDFISGQSNQFEMVSTSAESTAVIIYTSGTTGRPKGAELTHSNLGWNADLCRHLFQFQDDDVSMTVLPMFHIFGQTCLMNASIMHGITNVIVSRFDASTVLELIQVELVNVFAGVPTMYWALLNHTDDTGVIDLDKIKENLRLCISGGASLPVQVLKDFEAMYDVAIYEGYGMSEGSPVVTFNHPGQERKPGSIGRPVWGVQVKLGDENDQPVEQGEKGQLLYRGHNVMKGYYKKPAESKEALKGGWMHSGDVATQDEDGFIYIVDRTKDMILRGGLNVYPREVEEVIIQHDKVSLVAVIGVPDDRLGEEVKACIVLNEGETLDKQEIIDWTKERIAAYKYPRQVEFLEALPMSATGKILKRELRK